MSKLAKISFVLFSISILSAYLFHPLLWKGSFYHLTALAFSFVLFSLYQQVKGYWSLGVFVMFVCSINNLLDELFFDPTKMQYNELLALLITGLITWLNRHKWINK